MTAAATTSSEGIARLPNDVLRHCMGFLATSDLAKSCEVARCWRALIDSPNGRYLWRDASIREGVPVVAGNGRNYKQDFRLLRPITISGRLIDRYLGEVVGEVPRMRPDRFTQLRNSADPFDPGLRMRDTHIVLVDPSALRITVGPDRPLRLDETRTLVEIPVAERAAIVPEDLTVPFTFKNLRMLAAYPLIGRENGPVFHPDSVDAVFGLCNASPDQNGLSLMRRGVVARNIPFNGENGQNAQVTRHGWQIMTVRQRAIFNVLEILETGACLDDDSPTYVRSAETFLLRGIECRPAIGDFAPGVGALVFDNFLDNYNVCVVPGVPAEVL